MQNKFLSSAVTKVHITLFDSFCNYIVKLLPPPFMFSCPIGNSFFAQQQSYDYVLVTHILVRKSASYIQSIIFVNYTCEVFRADCISTFQRLAYFYNNDL